VGGADVAGGTGVTANWRPGGAEDGTPESAGLQRGSRLSTSGLLAGRTPERRRQGPRKLKSRPYQPFAVPCQSISYPSSLVSEHIAANAANLLLKTSSAWDFS